ncbi:bifunctional precorrin-2 dehydrogenase/sirohydrochlorin ferrochelatase [Sporosarcina sp. YIM B06819]|uniref:precorrin-2 dehydrogenase/sirohydrochlorin ferrochelatase family protein n=1 Tax=Sporosarcina sp. YIM B06819 TaxID=3081769 RepID=UPI00298D2A7D|nr:NAD(P)-dependent oxidoreductase [Sporosarcina sp. YIM B06819]
MGTYPIMLNMKNKAAVVVGGGTIAYRKTLGLLQAGANVTVISPALHLKMEALFIDKQIKWHNKAFEPQDLQDALLVIAATNQRQVNAFVAASTGEHQLVNVVDSQALSDFQVPAKLERGDLTICVATGGSSPSLATVIRDELAEKYDDSYKDYLNFLAFARDKVKHSRFDQPTKMRILKEITGESYRQSYGMQQAFLEMIDRFENDYSFIERLS